MNWQAEGHCATASPSEVERFFSEDMVEQSLVASEYCYDCPVRDLCLQLALSTQTYWGVWGGATQEHLRDALALDEHGRTDKDRAHTTRCPKCRTEDYETGNKTRLGVEVVCVECGLSWETRARLD